MSRVFITGSSEGLGLMAGQLLVEQGHEVVLHARNGVRAAQARRGLPQAIGVVEGDVTTIAGMRLVALGANRFGRFDAVIHNVGIGYRERQRIETADKLPHVFAINVLAPYVLTCLINRPDRLIYLSSGMHRHATAEFGDILWRERTWDGSQAYAESKLYDVLLAFAMARIWPDTLSNSLEPGWVPTRMGGAGAPGDIREAHRTQAWLAVSDQSGARATGHYFFHMRRIEPNPQAQDRAMQDRVIALCQQLSGVALPRARFPTGRHYGGSHV